MKIERDLAFEIIFQEGREGLTGVEAIGFLEAVTSHARRLEAIFVRQCNGYRNDSQRYADEASEAKCMEALRAHFDGAGLGMTLNSDPRGCAIGIATPKTHRYNGMGGRSDGWKLDVEALAGRATFGEADRAEDSVAATVTQQRKSGGKLVIGSDVIGVLERSRAEADCVFLPPGKMERGLYQQTDAVLKLAGGKWNRSRGGHVFKSEEAADVLDHILTAGEVLDRKAALQAFYTPAPLAARVLDAANISPGMTLLEPSAGAGALAIPAQREHGAKVTTVEIDLQESNLLRAYGLWNYSADFMTIEPGGMLGDQGFDRVVMNPPFSKQQDARHVMHAAKFLKPGGRLVAIMSPSAAIRTTGPGKAFLDLVAAWGGTFEQVEAGAFKESGTNVATVILTLDRPA